MDARPDGITNLYKQGIGCRNAADDARAAFEPVAGRATA